MAGLSLNGQGQAGSLAPPHKRREPAEAWEEDVKPEVDKRPRTEYIELSDDDGDDDDLIIFDPGKGWPEPSQPGVGTSGPKHAQPTGLPTPAATCEHRPPCCEASSDC